MLQYSDEERQKLLLPFFPDNFVEIRNLDRIMKLVYDNDIQVW